MARSQPRTTTTEGLQRIDDASWVESVRRGLVEWDEKGHRPLPWRGTGDPYRVLVSELMLVQTTVAAVEPYFERFLARFPTVQALAAADESEVLKAWEGLGYYRRARQLHQAAQAIVRDHTGLVPDDLDALRALPGVGRYIAGAVLSFAFDRPAPIVEANTQRVLARLLAWRGDVAAKATQDALWQAAERLVPERGAGRFNQALMELGATVCLVRQPLCLLCPLTTLCAARAEGIQEDLPVKSPKPPPLVVSEACAIVRDDAGQLLIVRRAPGGLWAGFWEFPTIHLSGADPARRSFGEPVELVEGVRLLTGVRVRVGAELRTVRYTVTKHRVTLTAHAATFLDGIPLPGPHLDSVTWAAPADLSTYPFGSAQKRLWSELGVSAP